MDRAHGLTTADVVVVYGIRDQSASSFPNLLTATAVASVVDTVTFTIVIGTAATVTSYGGLVARVNGGNLPSALGYSAVVAQSVARTSDVLTVTGNTTWAAFAIGDYINLYGCRANLTGASLGIDGTYKVASFATTALTLIPVGNQPTGQPNITATDAGGALIKRTCMRISFARVFDYERERIEFVPRPSGDISASLPVAITGGTLPAVTTVSTVSSVTAIVGASIAEDAAATANPLIVGGVVRTAAAPIVTPVAGDSMRLTTTTDGRLIINPYQYPEACWQYAAAASGIVNTTTAVTIKAAGAASIRNYITGIDYWSEALTNATEIAIRDGAAGTVIWRAKIGTGGLLAGRSITFPTPIRGTAATLLEVVTLTASGAGAVYFNATGFVAP
jgi:hypothetical protein